MSKKYDPSGGYGGIPINVVVTHLIQLTCCELETLSGSDQVDLIKLAYLPYILNGFKDPGLQVPSKFSEVWARCKAIIEKEVGK